MTEAPAPILLDVIPPDPALKYELRRTPGIPTFPEPGARRFNLYYMQLAVDSDPTLDAHPAEDQSDWQQYDVFDQQGWLLWTGRAI